ncbi:MAG: phospholipase D-like domain-containing protein [Gemmatimonadota bacterium]|nr:phospholipase D-like domain-containing protein [Gemmatimonadota bacterium]
MVAPGFDRRSVVGFDEGLSVIDRAVSRAVGAERIEGNSVRLLRDAAENYPAWLEAILAARHYVLFEAYIMRDDAAGRFFADALIERSRAGVKVRVIYDWLGALGKTRSRLWTLMRAAGVEVRCFNRFSIASPLGWVHRDHRKSIVVDGQVAFVTGLCVGDAWVGDPSRNIAPWRDTGVEIRGPAVADVEKAFARVWGVTGTPMPANAQSATFPPHGEGDVSVRIVASEPWSGKLLRLDEVLAGAASETLWLTDAYYAGMSSHVQALRAAARDGVDVRLLVPGGSDLPVLRMLSRAGYRPLLEAGVRVFEWNGPMLHAKTAVADRRLARVGSSNLNIASWLGNYELDAVIEDATFAEELALQYERDLSNSREVVLYPNRRERSVARRSAAEERRRQPRKRGEGGASSGVAGALRLGNTVTAAVTDHRVLGSSDARAIGVGGAILIALALVATLWPRVLAVPFALLSVWFGISLVIQAHRLERPGTSKG